VQFLNKRLIFKNIVWEIVGSVVMGLGQTDVWSLQNSVMLLGLDFMPLDQIANMSLNGLRRRVATRDKTQTMTQMDELLVALDLRHRGFS
jgi:hypothetical protein